MRLGLLGRKLGMTRIYTEDGTAVPVTIVELGPCTVMRKRSPDKHGYSALQLGFGAKRAKLVNRPEKGAFDKIGQEPTRVLREFRVPVEELDQYNEGQVVDCTLFAPDQRVDICGISKGRGFSGVMKRHHMAGGPATHGSHEYKRHGGSIGCRIHPGRVWKGKRMAGQQGNAKITTQNIKVVKVMPEDHLVLLHGPVPGPNRGVVEIRPAVKA